MSSWSHLQYACPLDYADRNSHCYFHQVVPSSREQSEHIHTSTVLQRYYVICLPSSPAHIIIEAVFCFR